jgi:superoxide reductase
MEELVANTSDGAKEKHVPDLKFEDGRIKVTIGSVLHPSLPEHHIEWIALVTGDKVQMSFLEPGMEPIAEFEEVEHGTIYEYCNLHGLWKTEF